MIDRLKYQTLKLSEKVETEYYLNKDTQSLVKIERVRLGQIQNECQASFRRCAIQELTQREEHIRDTHNRCGKMRISKIKIVN